MIIYFSGTGNSQYCAETLGRLLDDQVVDSADFIRNGQPATLHSDRPWVFCAPVYMAYIPLVFEKFIQESTFEGNDQFYFVVTLGGSEKGGSISPKMLPPLCKKLGKRYLGAGHISMPRNYVMLFSLPTPDEIKEKLDKTDQVLPEFARLIRDGKPLPEYKVNPLEYAAVRPFLGFFYKALMHDNKFSVDDTCVGCGLCEACCPLGNITLMEGKPHWNGTCTHCAACINRCPTSAIQYGNKTRNAGRYHIKMYRNS